MDYEGISKQVVFPVFLLQVSPSTHMQATWKSFLSPTIISNYFKLLNLSQNICTVILTLGLLSQKSRDLCHMNGLWGSLELLYGNVIILEFYILSWSFIFFNNKSLYSKWLLGSGILDVILYLCGKNFLHYLILTSKCLYLYIHRNIYVFFSFCKNLLYRTWLYHEMHQMYKLIYDT